MTKTSQGSSLCLQVPRSVYDGMMAHAAEVFPREAVGLLAGVDGVVQRRAPLHNLRDSRRFLADPFEQFEALRQFSAVGLEPLAVYHSHPCGGTSLSPEDLFHARRLPYVQLVIAIGRTNNPLIEVAAYEIVADEAKEVSLEVVPE